MAKNLLIFPTVSVLINKKCGLWALCEGLISQSDFKLQTASLSILTKAQ